MTAVDKHRAERVEFQRRMLAHLLLAVQDKARGGAPVTEENPEGGQMIRRMLLHYAYHEPPGAFFRDVAAYLREPLTPSTLTGESDASPKPAAEP